VLRRRLAGALLALLVHGAVFLVLSFYVIADRPQAEPVFTLLVLPEIVTTRETPVDLRTMPESAPILPLPQLPPLPPAPSISLPPPMAAEPPPQTPAPPDLAGIGRVIFGCKPEDLATLTPEERARCTSAGLGTPPDEASLAAIAELAAEENVRFEYALLRKQQPLLLPCAGGIGISLYTVLCLADGLINGFDLDSGKYPVYAPWPDENGPAGVHRQDVEE
jgi:hypothetical protein